MKKYKLNQNRQAENTHKTNEQSDTESSDVLCEIDANGIATLTLNRVGKKNAFDDAMIESLTHYLDTLAAIPTIRCLLLRANGTHFSAGADLHWMQSMAEKSVKENHQDAQQLAHLMQVLDTFPHPTIAVVQGWALGGALGLICCCDIVIAQSNTQFCLSEVKLGLIPATIGPYVCRAIGVRYARRYMLTAERIDANTAQHIGLIHLIVDTEAKADAKEYRLEQQITQLTQAILNNSPTALQQAKALCHTCENQPIDKKLIKYTSHLIADIRVSEQGQEGLSAFFDKRQPSWCANTKVSTKERE
ncbi:MAG: enoyl-CoA hydratase-related protein [Photobacterium frigidiphilum]|uniref:enoyl-CoA hydratase-related protein n=1 Tax=Photobacterium frigidiphilum TaxID=264736 RepID=UPI003001EB9A